MSDHRSSCKISSDRTTSLFTRDKYHQKYVQLRRLTRDLMLENAALSSRVAAAQLKVQSVQRSLRSLLHRLARLERKRRQERAAENDKKQSAVTTTETQLKSCIAAELLDSNGLPRLPLSLQNGGLTLLSTGRLLPQHSALHKASCLYPVGYTAARVYVSTQLLTPTNGRAQLQSAVYTCRIVVGDTPAAPPRFLIGCRQWCRGEADIEAATTDQCHSLLLTRLQSALLPLLGASSLDERVGVHVCGDLFFGLCDSRVRRVLQLLAGLSRCCGQYESISCTASDSAVHDPAVCPAALCSRLQQFGLPVSHASGLTADAVTRSDKPACI